MISVPPRAMARCLLFIFAIQGLSCGGGSNAKPTVDTERSATVAAEDATETSASQEITNSSENRLLAAGKMYELGAFDRAAALLKDLPVSVESQFLWAKIARSQQNYNEAVIKLLSISGLQSSLEKERRLELVAVMIEAQQIDEALVEINNLLTGELPLDSVARRRLLGQKGDILITLGHFQEAQRVLNVTRTSTTSPKRQQQIDLLLARCRIELGQKKAAKKILVPLSLDARNSQIMLDAYDMMTKSGLANRYSAEQKLDRARRLMELKAWDAAIDAVDPLVNSGKRNKVTEEALWIHAQILFKRRNHYKEAIAALEKVIALKGVRKDEAEFMLARAYSRLDEDLVAIKKYKQFSKRWKDEHRRSLALFYAGRLEFYLGQHKNAANTLRSLVGNPSKKRHKSSLIPSSRRDAHFLAGLSLFLENNPKEAADHFEAANVGCTHREALLRNNYWIAVSKMEAADPGAEDSLRQLCSEDNTTWYARLAAQRLTAKSLETGPCDLAGFVSSASKPVLPQSPSEILASIAGADELAGFFSQAGLFRHAATVLEKLPRDHAVTGKWTQKHWIELYSFLGAAHKAVRLAGGSFVWPGTEDNGWQIPYVYPRPHAGLIKESESLHNLPSMLIYSIARKESLFDPKAVSYVGAMGLMQMMPKTYEKNRQKAGLPPLVEGTLPGPEESIKAASFELAHLIETFQSLPLAIMAYNGGSAAVNRWLDRSGDLPMDVFVEKAGFTQTRNYVRRVWQNIVRYRLLAGEPMPQLPLVASRLQTSKP